MDLDITQNLDPDFPMSVEPVTTSHNFRFRYEDAAYSSGPAESCQFYTGPNPNCLVDDLLHTPEGTY